MLTSNASLLLLRKQINSDSMKIMIKKSGYKYIKAFGVKIGIDKGGNWFIQKFKNGMIVKACHSKSLRRVLCS